MYKSYFAARSALHEALWTRELDLDGAAVPVLYFLVANAMYREHAGQQAGYVNDDVLGEEVIARFTGSSPRTVRRAMQELSAKGIIRKHRRPVFAGGRQPDLIEVVWVTEGDTVAPSVPATVASSVPATVASSSSFVEEVNTEEGAVNE